MNSKICSLNWRPFTLSFTEPFNGSKHHFSVKRGIFIELVDDFGVKGFGEVSPLENETGENVDHLIGLIENYGPFLLKYLEEKPVFFSENTALTLQSGLDIALLDLRAKTINKSVAEFISSDPIALTLRSNAIIGTIGTSEIIDYAKVIVENGYRALKVKVGASSLENDFERLRILREEFPEILLRVDANGSWDRSTAFKAIDKFSKINISLIEQPISPEDVEGLNQLSNYSDIPIAADESIHSRILRDNIFDGSAVDYIVLKPMLLGGITTAWAIAQKALQCDIKIIVTTAFDSSIGIAAAVQLAAAIRNGEFHGLATGEYLKSDLILKTLKPERGMIHLHDQVGLGIIPERDAVDKIAHGPWRNIELCV